MDAGLISSKDLHDLSVIPYGLLEKTGSSTQIPSLPSTV